MNQDSTMKDRNIIEMEMQDLKVNPTINAIQIRSKSHQTLQKYEDQNMNIKFVQETERARRSKLIYGVEDLRVHKAKLAMKKQKHSKINPTNEQEEMIVKVKNQGNQKGLCEYLKISYNSKCKYIYDAYMKLIVVYSTFSTIFYVAFDFEDNRTIRAIDNVAFCFFLLEIILNLLTTYYDYESDVEVKDFYKILYHYANPKTGTLIIDTIATFPFEFIGPYDTILFREFRLIRLGNMMDSFNPENKGKVFSILFGNTTREQRLIFNFLLGYIFKIIKLIIQAMIICYFLAMLWYLISLKLNTDGSVFHQQTFITHFELQEFQADLYDRFISSCYFTLTTLSVIGYGDYYAYSNLEKIILTLIMIVGVVFFSYIMSSFISIIQSFQDLQITKDESGELHNWMTLLKRFINNKNLPNHLIEEIDYHFQYFWSHDRLSQLSKDNEFLNALPIHLRKNIMVHYLFDDVFFTFRSFFNTMQYEDTQFLYDIAFDLKPRQINPQEVSDYIIYDEEEEVPEMYFIKKGIVGVGFQVMKRNDFSIDHSNKNQSFKIGIKINQGLYVCDYYVLNDTKSQFIYVALTTIKAFSLSKKFLKAKIYDKYPEIISDLKKQSVFRYHHMIMDKMLKYRADHLEEINGRSTYKNIIIQDRQRNLMEEQAIQTAGILAQPQQIEKDLDTLLYQRIREIQIEIQKLHKTMNEFEFTFDMEFKNIGSNNLKLLKKLGNFKQNKRR